jgi:hypothetical protein
MRSGSSELILFVRSSESLRMLGDSQIFITRFKDRAIVVSMQRWHVATWTKDVSDARDFTQPRRRKERA